MLTTLSHLFSGTSGALNPKCVDDDRLIPNGVTSGRMFPEETRWLLPKVESIRMAKVFSWYDNEWGYASRLADAAAMIARRL